MAQGSTSGLFPTLLRGQFLSLDPRVIAVHSGSSRRFHGTAVVKRGSSWVARGLCALASLPRDQVNAPVTVELKVTQAGEYWTRQFGDSPAMSSTLRGRMGLLEERLGPVTMSFQLIARAGGIDWTLRRVALLGCPLPVRWFRVVSRSDAHADFYHFEVAAQLIGVGLIIRYEGALRCEPV
jgi:Domain of unknown function (DUF4166)